MAPAASTAPVASSVAAVRSEFPKDNLEEAKAMVNKNETFNCLRLLGVGSFASVWLAKDRRSSIGREVALKVFLHGPPKQFEEDAMYELSVMRRLSSHPNIVHFFEVHCQSSATLLAYEALEMDLKQHLRRRGEFVGSRLQNAAMQILTALGFCHRLRIVHCDISPKNILVDQGGSVLKVGDFGTAETCTRSGHPHTRDIVTLWYRAPELLLGCPVFTEAIDIWSFGCVFGEMAINRTLFNRLPFQGNFQIEVLFAIFQLLGTPTEASWPGVTKLPYFNDLLPRWQEGCFRKTEIGAHLSRALDGAGLQVLCSALERCPKKRLSAPRLLAQSFFSPTEPERATPSRWLSLLPSPSRRRAARSSKASDADEVLVMTECVPLAAPASSPRTTRAPLRGGGCMESVLNMFNRIRLVPSAHAPCAF